MIALQSKQEVPTVQQSLAELGNMLDILGRDGGELFTSPHAPLSTSVQGSLKNAKAALETIKNTPAATDQGIFNIEDVDRFHHALKELRVNLEALPPGKEYPEPSFFGSNKPTSPPTKTPGRQELKGVIKKIDEIQEKANNIPGFAEVSKTTLAKNSSATEAVGYARRSLSEVESLLANQTLMILPDTDIQVTPIKKGADKVTEALEKVRKSLEAMVDKNGERVIQTDKNGKPLADQLSGFKTAMDDARAAAQEFTKLSSEIHLGLSALHKQRGEMVKALLDENKGFQGKIEKVDALKAKESGAGKKQEKSEGGKNDKEKMEAGGGTMLPDFSGLVSPGDFQTFFVDEPDAATGPHGTPSVRKNPVNGAIVKRNS